MERTNLLSICYFFTELVFNYELVTSQMFGENTAVEREKKEYNLILICEYIFIYSKVL